MSEKVLSEVIKQIESAKKTPIAVVLGSGLSSFTSTFTDQTSIDFCDIPTFPKTTVPGHDGRLISTIYKETPLLIFSGRFHLYEGLTVSQICCQVSLAATTWLQRYNS